MKKIILMIIGLNLMALGVLGLIVPFLPGWLFIFVGLSFFAPKFTERLKRRMFRKFSKHELVYYDKWRKSGVDAGFTTRRFALFVSKTDDFLDAATRAGFHRAMAESKIAAAHGVKPFANLVVLNQVHGDTVAVLEDASAVKDFLHLKQTDGVLTNVKGSALLALTADCLPVFFKAPGWVGLVHAGWRGTRGRIVKKAFALLKEKSRAKNSQIQVFFGPCIGAGRYEVGPEFKNYFPKPSVRARHGKLTFDLAGENKRQLLRSGLPERNLTELDLCTVEENADFYSFRMEKEKAGRMISFIILR